MKLSHDHKKCQKLTDYFGTLKIEIKIDQFNIRGRRYYDISE